MNGKKVVFIFLAITVVSGLGMALWIKQGYETRPKNVQIEPEGK